MGIGRCASKLEFFASFKYFLPGSDGQGCSLGCCKRPSKIKNCADHRLFLLCGDQSRTNSRYEVLEKLNLV